MPERFPAGDIKRLVYISQDATGDLGVLQAHSSGRTPHPAQQLMYDYRLEQHVKDLAALAGGPFDAIVMPDSTHKRALPYLQGMPAPRIADLTSRFTKAVGTSSGKCQDYSLYLSGISYRPAKDEHQFNSLLIVDEVAASGKTAQAIIDRLREAGMPLTCEVTLAAPLWLRQTPSFLD